MSNGWRMIKSLVHKIRLHGRRGKGMAESFSREKNKARTAERKWMRNPVWPSSCVTPAGTSNELDVQNEWEENTHTHKRSDGMYVCMVIPYSRVWINRVRLPILLVVSWTGKIIFPCPRACLRIWSRETGSAAPFRVSLLISILRLNLVLTYGIPPEFRGGVHLWNRHTPSGQSRVFRVTQLRTDGVHCRESTGTGSVNLKVVPNECCLGRSPWINKYSPLFPTPAIGMKWACWKCRRLVHFGQWF